MSHITEVHAYIHILKELTEKKGWRRDQIYTQNECQNNPLIKRQLRNTTPENIVVISPTQFYVIEAKSTRNALHRAVDEARNDYANIINRSAQIRACFITGIAGNEREGYVASSQFFVNGTWQTITENGVEVTGLLSKVQIEQILTRNNPNLVEVEISDQEFLKSAEEINEILHEGGINKDYRARVISAVLLALVEGTDINLDTSPTILINSINTRVSVVLSRNEKPEFARFISIDLPSSEDNHNKFKKAIVLTIQELLGLNIRSAMSSGKDVLGKFYEVFLKYGNGAKEIGIVLTPRHVTKFAAQVLNITSNDFVYDPTCGTGGFLVAAYDEVKRKTPVGTFGVFKKCGLYGIEQQDSVVALAIVNMIFRGDGKTNITEGNCFAKWLNATSRDGHPCAEYLGEDIAERIPPISKVLMNPPFPNKKTDDKEYAFIVQALKQMQNDGLLFSVIPRSTLVKQSKYRAWRVDLLNSNTLLAVIDFPEDLFYPIGVQTCGLIIKKGVPHPREQNVLWLKINTDGLLKSKGKRLPSARTDNQLEDKKQLVADFIQNPMMAVPNIPEIQIACPVDFNDSVFELLPEVYLDERAPSDDDVRTRVEDTLRDLVAFMVKDNRQNDFRQYVLNPNTFNDPPRIATAPIWSEKTITELFAPPIKTGDYHCSGELDIGEIPLVSCSSENSGFEGKFDVPTENTIRNAITIASDGQPLATYYQYYPFVAKDNVILGIPAQQYRFTTMLFFVAQINSLRWRFSYGRKCYLNKIHKIKLYLPFTENGQLSEDFIENMVKNSPSWTTLRKLIL